MPATERPDSGPRPLRGVRILDFTRQLAGAGCTRILAVLGAEVLRVEWPEPPALDFLRVGGTNPDGSPSLDASPSFAQHNVEKLSLAVNARTEAGRAILRELVPHCDVVVESFTAGVLDRWGLGYRALELLHPGIVYVAASGWGHTGPLKDYRSIGPVAQAYSGLTATSGLPGREPAGWGFSYMDHMAAAMNAAAVMIGLMRRKLTGDGEFIDAGQSQTGASLLGPMLLDASVNGARPRPDGNRELYRNCSPQNAYRCRGIDDWIAISIRTTAEWRSLCRLAGLPALLARTELDSLEARIDAEASIDEAIEAWTRDQDRSELMDRLQSVGVPAGAVQHIDDKVLRDPQLEHRGFYQIVDDPILGSRRYESVPVQSPAWDTSIQRARPLLGEHTRTVLKRLLRYSDARIDELLSRNVLHESA